MQQKGFFLRWREGIQQVTPLQQVRAKRAGVIGQLVGILFVGIALLLQGLYYWIPLLLFTVFLLVVEFIGVQQQLYRLEALEVRHV